MSDKSDEFWSSIPEEELQPARVMILEALRTVGDSLSAIRFVDVLDGHVSQWEAARHLSELEALGMVERMEGEGGGSGSGGPDSDRPYRLRGREEDEDG